MTHEERDRIIELCHQAFMEKDLKKYYVLIFELRALLEQESERECFDTVTRVP